MSAQKIDVLFIAGVDSSAAVLACDLFNKLTANKLTVRGAVINDQNIDDLTQTRIDVIITLDDAAADGTPHLGGNPRRMHWPMPDQAEAEPAAAIESHLPGLQTIVSKTIHASALHLEPGVSTCVFRPDVFDPPVHMPLVAAAGFKCIDLNCAAGTGDFPWDQPDKVAQLARISRDTGVAVFSVHAECGLGASSGTRTEAYAIDSLKRFADLAVELGAVSVTMHAGRAADHLHDSFAQLRDYVRHLPCRYAWENGVDRLTAQQHGDWIRTLDPAAFSFVLDTGHANINGNTESYIDACAGLFSNLHVNDNNGEKDQHRTPGRGTVPWQNLLPGLERCGYVGPLMLEVEARDRRDDATALAELRASIDHIKQSAPV